VQAQRIIVLLEQFGHGPPEQALGRRVGRDDAPAHVVEQQRIAQLVKDQQVQRRPLGAGIRRQRGLRGVRWGRARRQHVQTP
jgi:hypothetical protein